MSAPHQRTGPVRVLLVDDDPDFTNVLRRRLVRRGLAVRTARDGGEAFSMIEVEPFDVVVLDVGLPDVDGMQLLRAIKRCSRSIEVIVLTGGHTGTLESIRAGAFDLFTKPVGADVLADRIIQAARSRTG
jgi:DNA-binding response OmpR family regulator